MLKSDIKYDDAIKICLKCQLAKCIYDKGNRNKKCLLSDQRLKSINIVHTYGSNVTDGHNTYDKPYTCCSDLWINTWGVRYKYTEY